MFADVISCLFCFGFSSIGDPISVNYDGLSNLNSSYSIISDYKQFQLKIVVSIVHPITNFYNKHNVIFALINNNLTVLSYFQFHNGTKSSHWNKYRHILSHIPLNRNKMFPWKRNSDRIPLQGITFESID